jgi:hypothetical protein
MMSPRILGEPPVQTLVQTPVQTLAGREAKHPMDVSRRRAVKPLMGPLPAGPLPAGPLPAGPLTGAPAASGAKD